MALPILSLGGDKWAIGESKLLGYNKLNNNYLANEFVATRATSSRLTNKQGVIEDSCYNLISRSETLDSWTVQNTTVQTNLIAAPNNTITADKIIPNTTSAQHRIFNNSLANDPSIFSVYAKTGGYNYISLGVGGGVAGGSIIFDIVNGTMSGTDINYTSSIDDAGNGWFKCSIKRSDSVIYPTTISRLIIIRNNNTTSDYIGDGGSGVYLWGTQVIQGLTERPYLKTTDRLNVPKIDYSYQGKPALLLEPQRTNLLLQSNTFDNASWTQTRCTTAPVSILNPENTNSSYFVKEDNSVSNDHTLVQVRATVHTIGNTVTLSGYFKASTRNWIVLWDSDGAPNILGVYFDVLNGTVGSIGSSILSYSITPSINGFYKCSITYNKISTTLRAVFSLAQSNGVYQYTGDNISGMYMYGTQVEVGSNATTYIPTTTATVIRIRDDSYHDLSVVAALNQSNFTLYVEGYLFSGFSSLILFGLSDANNGAGTNSVGSYGSIGGFTNNNSTSTAGGGALPAGTYFKFIVQRNGTQVKFFRNGVQIWITQTLPIINYRYLIVNSGGSTYSVAKLDLYNETLTDAECINMTIL